MKKQNRLRLTQIAMEEDMRLTVSTITTPSASQSPKYAKPPRTKSSLFEF